MRTLEKTHKKRTHGRCYGCGTTPAHLNNVQWVLIPAARKRSAAAAMPLGGQTSEKLRTQAKQGVKKAKRKETKPTTRRKYIEDRWIQNV